MPSIKSKKTRRKKSKKSTTKIASSKKTKVSSKTVTPKDLIPADYNPREMDDDARKGLQHSMKEFDDISGITWNKTTKNIITGHHRWQNLIELHGLEALSFKHLMGDRYAIMADGKDTSYSMRVVEWDDSKEKAANVTANSNKIEGQFTADLTGILSHLKLDLPDDMFKGLRFDDLKFDFKYVFDEQDDDDSWETDIEAVKKVEEDDHQEQPEFSQITITCRTDQKEDIINLVREALDEEKYEIN